MYVCKKICQVKNWVSWCQYNLKPRKWHFQRIMKSLDSFLRVKMQLNISLYFLFSVSQTFERSCRNSTELQKSTSEPRIISLFICSLIQLYLLLRLKPFWGFSSSRKKSENFDPENHKKSCEIKMVFEAIGKMWKFNSLIGSIKFAIGILQKKNWKPAFVWNFSITFNHENYMFSWS